MGRHRDPCPVSPRAANSLQSRLQSVDDASFALGPRPAGLYLDLERHREAGGRGLHHRNHDPPRTSSTSSVGTAKSTESCTDRSMRTSGASSCRPINASLSRSTAECGLTVARVPLAGSEVRRLAAVLFHFFLAEGRDRIAAIGNY